MAAGMFAMPGIGNTMALAHYLGALAVGLLFRFYGVGAGERPTMDQVRQGSIFSRAVKALIDARREDGRHFGQMMGDAVTESIKTLLMICGFIMLFSTVVKIIEVVGAYRLIAWPFEVLLPVFGLDTALVPALVAGLFEIDLGTVAAAGASAPLAQKIAIAGAIIAWSGLSVYGQVASVLTGTDIRMGPYALARLLHAIFAIVFTFMLLDAKAVSGALTRMASTFGPLPGQAGHPGFWPAVQHGLTWALVVPVGLTLVGACAAMLSGGVRWFGFQTRR